MLSLCCDSVYGQYYVLGSCKRWSFACGKRCGSLQRVYSIDSSSLHLQDAFELSLRRERHFCIIHYPHQPSNTPLSFKLLNSSGSRNLLMVTSSASPFLLLVLSTKSLASACAVAGSRGRSLISLSSGSPGTMDQRSKTRERETWPWVWI